MNERPRTPLGTISIWLGAVPLLALVSWFVFYTPCGSFRRTLIEGAMFWGTLVAVPFAIVAAVKERPRKRALIGFALGLVPLACVILLIAAVVFSIGTGGRGIPGVLELTTTGGGSPPGTIEAGVFESTETKYYDVTGSTREELVAGITAHGPKGFDAETEPFYHWNYTYRTENGSCRIDRVRVDSLIVFTYPRWTGPAAEPDVVDAWRKRIAHVEQHEQRHAEIDRATGQDLYDTLAGLPPFPACAALEKEIAARAKAILANGREANNEFDRITDHGRRLANTAP